MSRKRLSRGVGAYALDKVVVALVQLASVPVLANVWGLSLYGTWAMIMTIPSFLVLGDFGIVNSAGARMVLFASRGDWEAARGTLHTAWLATVSIVAVIVVVLAGGLWFLPPGIVPTTIHFNETQSRATILMLLVYGLLTIICRLNSAALRADMHYSINMLYGTGTYALENALVIVVVVLGLGPVVAAASLLIARIFVLIGLYVLGSFLVPQLRPGFAEASRLEWGQLLGPAIAASAIGFGTAAYLQGSVMLLGALAGAAAIPAFTAVRTLSRLGVQMATLISLPVSQEFGNALAKDQVYRSGRLFGLVFLPALVLALGSGLGLVLLGGPFVTFWTHGAIHANMGLIVTMAISSFAAMFWSPLSNLIMVINQQRSYSYANLVASGAGLLIIYLFAKTEGAVAVGYAFVVVDGVTLTAVLLFIARCWLPLATFRSGVTETLREIRTPFNLLRSLRRTT
ncbi:hypothetical protein OSJ57_19175 [Sphingomonas sp. HH69]